MTGSGFLRIYKCCVTVLCNRTETVPQPSVPRLSPVRSRAEGEEHTLRGSWKILLRGLWKFHCAGRGNFTAGLWKFHCTGRVIKKNLSLQMNAGTGWSSCGATRLGTKIYPLSAYWHTPAFVYGAPSPSHILGFCSAIYGIGSQIQISDYEGILPGFCNKESCHRKSLYKEIFL